MPKISDETEKQSATFNSLAMDSPPGVTELADGSAIVESPDSEAVDFYELYRG